MQTSGEATILHADLDAFYASVVLLSRPDLVGKPVAVGGGVVLSATYEARAMGVRGAMRIGEARKLCPGLIVVDGAFGDYVDYSDRVFDVFRDFSPLVEPISIDEAFIDIGGAVHLFGPPATIAEAIRERVRQETSLPVSVGGAQTKFLAKIASRVAKPDGSLIITPGTELDFLHALPVGHLWGVGPVTLAQLSDLGVSTIGELAGAPVSLLATRVGPHRARHLHALAWNRDPRGVVSGRRSSSVGAQRAFGGDHREPDFLRGVLSRLASRVGARLRRGGRAGSDAHRPGRGSATSRPSRGQPRCTRRRLRVPCSIGPLSISRQWFSTNSRTAASVFSASRCRTSCLLRHSNSNSHSSTMTSSAGVPRELELQALDAAVDDLREKFGKGTVGPASDLLGSKSPFSEGLSDIMTRD